MAQFIKILVIFPLLTQTLSFFLRHLIEQGPEAMSSIYQILGLTLSKLPSDMLCTRVSASDQSSSSISLELFILSGGDSPGGGESGLRSGKYMLWFFWNLSFRIILNDEDVGVAAPLEVLHNSSPMPLSVLLWRAREGGSPRGSLIYHGLLSSWSLERLGNMLRGWGLGSEDLDLFSCLGVLMLSR